MDDSSDKREVNHLLNGDIFLYTVIRLLDSQIILIESAFDDNRTEEEYI